MTCNVLAVQELTARQTPGYAIGGLVGGEEKTLFVRTVSQVRKLQPPSHSGTYSADDVSSIECSRPCTRHVLLDWKVERLRQHHSHYFAQHITAYVTGCHAHMLHRLVGCPPPPALLCCSAPPRCRRTSHAM